MAFEANEFGRSIAAPGLPFGDQPYTSVSRVMADAVDSEGGFPVYGTAGEAVKVYGTKPESGIFLGVAQRVVIRDSYEIGNDVSVITAGQVWVKAEVDVTANSDAYITSAGGWGVSASGATAVSGAKYLTNASAGSYAVLELK